MENIPKVLHPIILPSPSRRLLIFNRLALAAEQEGNLDDQEDDDHELEEDGAGSLGNDARQNEKRGRRAAASSL